MNLRGCHGSCRAGGLQVTGKEMVLQRLGHVRGFRHGARRDLAIAGCIEFPCPGGERTGTPRHRTGSPIKPCRQSVRRARRGAGMPCVAAASTGTIVEDPDEGEESVMDGLVRTFVLMVRAEDAAGWRLVLANAGGGR